MGLPDIIIEFSKKAVTAIQNGSTGIVGIMLKDAKNKGAMVLRSVDEYIPKKMFWDRSLLFLLHFLPEHVWRD